jgi:L-iditol 2-dehydrogenase
VKALLLTEYSKLSIADLPIPEVGEEDVLVRVRACGVCGSDVHGYDGTSGRRIPPLVMGHEAAGVIEQVGAAVGTFHRGDRVTFDSTVSCGRCAFCRCGDVNLCDNRMVLGVSCGDYRRDGAFAEYVSVPARILYRLPDALPFEHAAVIEALSVAVHAVGRGQIGGPSTWLGAGRWGADKGQTGPGLGLDAYPTAVVVGCGMIGMLVIQVLRAKGVTDVIAVDVDQERRELALRFGAIHALDGRDPTLSSAIHALTGGWGADVAYEAVGRQETVLNAIRSVRKGGTVTLIGNLTATVGLPLQEVVTRELRLLGSCASSGEYPECIDLLARGVVDVAPLISVTAPLEEGPSWFERLHRGGERLMKVILTP